MHLLCRLRGHKWRPHDDGERAYDKCDRCGHYRAAGHWWDGFDEAKLPPPSGHGIPPGPNST